MFSKKALAAAGLVILIAVLAMVASFKFVRDPSSGGPGVRAALSLVSPLQSAITSVINAVETVWSRYLYLVHAAEENERLKKALAQAMADNTAGREALLENKRLRECLELKTESPLVLLPARVVARDPSPWMNTLIVDRGSDDGVGRGCPVVVAAGIVGFVLEASGGYAKVLLMVDRNSSADVLVQETRARGVASGTGDTVLRLQYALRQLTIPMGAVVVTSGLDGIYPKGLRVGAVTQVLRKNSGMFQEIEITPSVDFKTLEEVMIVLNPPHPEVGGE